MPQITSPCLSWTCLGVCLSHISFFSFFPITPIALIAVRSPHFNETISFAGSCMQNKCLVLTALGGWRQSRHETLLPLFCITPRAVILTSSCPVFGITLPMLPVCAISSLNGEEILMANIYPAIWNTVVVFDRIKKKLLVWTPVETWEEAQWMSEVLGDGFLE